MKKNFIYLLCCFISVSSILTGCGTTSTTSEELSDVTEATVTETESDGTTVLESNDEATNESEYTDIISNISYIDDGETYHMLDLYGTQSVSEATPTVIEVHGGGFIGGSKENNADHSIFFAQQGYTVVTTDYSKIPRNGDFVDAIQDLFATYQWVFDHAEEYNFDLNNIFLSGDSAGGYYVLLTCAIWNSEELQTYFDVTVPDFNFSSYITTCPAANILKNQEYFYEESGPNAHVAQTIGEDLLFNEDLMAHLDLMSNVDASVFEGIYMITTPNDTTTGEDVALFDNYLTENNVSHTTISYESEENELGHTFNISHSNYSESQIANQDMVDYMNSLLK